MQNDKMSSKKKTIFGIIGILLLIGTIGSGGLNSIGNWSSSELIGYNMSSIFAIVFGLSFIYLGFKK